MMTYTQEQRLRHALPDFYIYKKARYVSETREVACGRYDTVKKIKNNRVYSGTFIVFPQSALCRVLCNAYVQTSPELWEFIEDDDEEAKL